MLERRYVLILQVAVANMLCSPLGVPGPAHRFPYVSQ